MFAGIVQSVGSVISVAPKSGGLNLALDLSGLDFDRVRLGDSIAVNGACLTVNGIEENIAHFDVSSETLSKCLVGDWETGDRVNLELALTLQTPIGGHLVFGHIDGAARLVQRTNKKDFTGMLFEVSRDIGKFVAAKGSVAIDGISLTTNTVTDENDMTQFEVMLVPHTLAHTNLGILMEDSLVHIEVDQIARYIQRIGEHLRH